MQAEYAMEFLLLALAAAVNGSLAMFLWRRRPAAGAGAFAALMACCACWSAGVLFQVVTPDFERHYVLIKLTYVAIMAVPVAWLVFCLEYAGQREGLNRARLALLCAPAVVFSVLSAGNWNQVFRHSEHVLRLGTLYAMENGRGPAWYAAAAYAYLLVLAGLSLIVRSAYRAPADRKRQAFFVVAAGALPWLSNGLFIVRASPLGDLDPTPFVFSVSGGLLAAALFRYRLLDLVPRARDLVVEIMPDCLVVMNEQGRIVDLNPAARKLIGQVRLGERVEIALDAWPALLKLLDEPKERAEIRLEGRWWETYQTAIRDSRGRTSGNVLMLREVTERKQAETQVLEALHATEAAARAKSEFLATVSHELRTPLNGIIGLSQLLLDTQLIAEQRDYVESIHASGELLLSVINDVLDFSRIEAGRMPIERYSFEVQTLLEEAADVLRYSAWQKGLVLSVRYPSNAPPAVVGDGRRLRQVILNLLGNAVKFTAKGSILVEAECLENDGQACVLRISVSDTGIGMSRDQLDRLFEPFQQGDTSMTRRFGGTGLGLAISKRLIDLMEGSISVESEAGAGSRFQVTLRLHLPAGG